MTTPDIFGGFRDVDRSGQAGSLVSYLDHVNSLAGADPYKRESIRLLELGQGDSVLEVGCGAGDDALALVPLVGTAGSVAGIDLSETMVETARGRAMERGAAVDFRVGNAERLEFADGSFDACRSMRTFQHLADPQKALSEMVRVSRSGGRVVIAEPDWGTMAVDSPDRALTRTLLNCRCDSTLNGWIGRQLPRLFHQAGLERISVSPVGFVLPDYDAAYVSGLSQAVQAAERTGAAPTTQIEQWLNQLQAAGRAGDFLMEVTVFVAGGHKR